jgi:hypothetical protein
MIKKRETHRRQRIQRRVKTEKNKKLTKQFLYNPKNPQKSHNIFNNANKRNTISIRYKTIEDVIKTIKKLEKLYKTKKYTHKRIVQVAMIMKIRLELLKNKKPKEYQLAEKYYEFLKKRTKETLKKRTKMVFSF